MASSFRILNSSVRIPSLPLVLLVVMFPKAHLTSHSRIDALELWCWTRLLSPLDCKAINPVHPKGNQPLIFPGRTDAEAPILWSLNAKSQLIKNPDAGKDRRQKQKGQQRMRWLDGITDSTDKGLSKLEKW